MKRFKPKLFQSICSGWLDCIPLEVNTKMDLRSTEALLSELSELLNSTWFPDDSGVPLIDGDTFERSLASVGLLYKLKRVTYQQYLRACRNLAFQLHPFPPTDRPTERDATRPSHRVQEQGYYPIHRDQSPTR